MNHYSGNQVVSIILCVRNGGAQLEEALASVMSQSYQDFELIVIDDASEDDTASILDLWSKENNKIRIFRNFTGLGLTRSLNVGLLKAKGCYIARIDHDDLWEKDKLRLQVEYLEKNRSIGLLGTNFYEIDESSGPVSSKTENKVFRNEEIRNAFYYLNPFCHSSIMMRKELIDSLGGYNEKYLYAQDYELWCRLARVSEVEILPDFLCSRRVSKSNISHKKERQQRWFALKVKLGWALSSGFINRLPLVVAQDIFVIIMPDFVKKLGRNLFKGPR